MSNDTNIKKTELPNQIQTDLYNAMLVITTVLPIISDAKRIELVKLLLDGYCTNCGSSKSCPCANKGVTH